MTMVHTMLNCQAKVRGMNIPLANATVWVIRAAVKMPKVILVIIGFPIQSDTHAMITPKGMHSMSLPRMRCHRISSALACLYSSDWGSAGVNPNVWGWFVWITDGAMSSGALLPDLNFLLPWINKTARYLKYKMTVQSMIAWKFSEAAVELMGDLGVQRYFLCLLLSRSLPKIHWLKCQIFYFPFSPNNN